MHPGTLKPTKSVKELIKRESVLRSGVVRVKNTDSHVNSQQHSQDRVLGNSWDVRQTHCGTQFDSANYLNRISHDNLPTAQERMRF